MSASGDVPIADALAIENLDVVYRVRGRDRTVLKRLNLRIGRGQSYGLVGESGSGKSTAALTAVRYLPRNGRVTGGRILVDGRDLMKLSQAKLRLLRTQSVSMVYQDPGRALNPSLRIGRQMSEVFEAALGLAHADALLRAADMLAKVQIPNPARVMANFPHELSGGMQQRVVIAMALSTNPTLLILDEPTTGLDATVEAEVLDLIARLRVDLSASILFISHSLPVIARMCDRIGVLYAGELVEEGPASMVLKDPRHPYTAALLRCAPRQGRRKQDGRLTTIPGFPPSPGAMVDCCIFADRCVLAAALCRQRTPPPVDLYGRSSRCHYTELVADIPHSEANVQPAATGPTRLDRPVLRARQLSKTYQVGGKNLRAVHDVTLDLWPGETLGLVGESGSGKSSIAKLLLGLVSPDAGSSIELDGVALPARALQRSQAQLKALQIVFQNPGSALNPSHSVRRLIGRGLARAGLRATEREEALQALARAVRLSSQHLEEKPRALSGGLKQRVAIARAFAGGPKVVVCDEPTSALDVSVQAAILNLLVDLQAEQHVSYIFISHDLRVVYYLSDRIAVLYLGRLMEIGSAAGVFSGPNHPYTEALLSAHSSAGDGARPRIRLEGEIPSAADLPAGCVFQTRCPRKIGLICEQEEPELMEVEEGHSIRCHIPFEELRSLQLKDSAGRNVPDPNTAANLRLEEPPLGLS
ncbi:MAG: dipeptide ABC transporter ATP-binding protein [Gammaproteobacteria bacterium]